MPLRFQTRIQRARFVVRGYTAEQMRAAAQGLLDQGILPRLARGEDINDAPAPPLSASYAKRKLRNGKKPIRDWNRTGRTLRSLKVLRAAPNVAVIGFTQAGAGPKNNLVPPGEIAAILNRRAVQFGVSRKEQGLLQQIFEGTAPPIRAEKVA